jgi:hypothetical protein
MSATVQDTMLQVRQLSADDQKEVVRQTEASLSLDHPDPTTTKILWFVIVGTLAFLAGAGLIAVAILAGVGKSAADVAPFVTLAIGGLVGIVAPSPTQSSR